MRLGLGLLEYSWSVDGTGCWSGGHSRGGHLSTLWGARHALVSSAGSNRHKALSDSLFTAQVLPDSLQVAADVAVYCAEVRHQALLGADTV
jgi:hypothetical protein